MIFSLHHEIAFPALTRRHVEHSNTNRTADIIYLVMCSSLQVGKEMTDFFAKFVPNSIHQISRSIFFLILGCILKEKFHSKQRNCKRCGLWMKPRLNSTVTMLAIAKQKGWLINSIFMLLLDAIPFHSPLWIFSYSTSQWPHWYFLSSGYIGGFKGLMGYGSMPPGGIQRVNGNGSKKGMHNKLHGKGSTVSKAQQY